MEDRDRIVHELETLVRHTRIRHVYVAEGGLAPPALAYVTPFARLSIPLAGQHAMDVAHANRPRCIHPSRGDVVWVPANAWNRPRWDTPVTVLTLLFGAKQIGVSLVRHTGATELPSETRKASIHGAQDDPTPHLVRALTIAASDSTRDGTHDSMHDGQERTHQERTHQDSSRNERQRVPLTRLLAESLLHAVLRQFTAPGADIPRKAVRTHEAICLYVQEHYQLPLTREDVARQFGLAPTHVSRLFRREGLVRFNEYVNLVRVNRAKFLLRAYGMPLKEVAARCGYTDVAYFCQVFKRLTALTPTQYRDAGPPPQPPDPTPGSPAHR